MSADDEICNWTDYDLLRPLYIAIAFTPLALFTNLNLMPNAHKAFALKHLVLVRASHPTLYHDFLIYFYVERSYSRDVSHLT